MSYSQRWQPQSFHDLATTITSIFLDLSIKLLNKFFGGLKYETLQRF